MRRVCFALALALSAYTLAAPQDLSTKVTADLPAYRIGTALEELGRSAGVRLQVAPGLKDEVVVLRLRDVPLEEAMRRIANAMDAQWQRESDGWRLVRPQSVELQAQRRDGSTRGRTLLASYRSQRERTGVDRPFSAAEAERYVKWTREMASGVQGIMGGRGFEGVTNAARGATGALGATPASRAILRLVEGIGIERLSTLPPNRRLVFGLRPTRMQQPMPANARSVFATLVSEQKVMNTAMQSGGPSLPGGAMNIGPLIGGGGTGNLDLGVSDAILVVTRQGEGLTLNLTAADPRGETIATGFVSLAPESSPASVAIPQEEPIKLSPLAAEFARLIGGRGGAVQVASLALSGSPGAVVEALPTFLAGQGNNANEPSAPSKELKALLLQPEKFDPLRFAPGEAVRAMAEAGQRNLIAVLPDSALAPMSRALVEGRTGPSALSAQLPTMGMVKELEDGWMTVLPVDRTGARLQTTDRDALGIFLRALDKAQWASLDDVSRFASAQETAPSLMRPDGMYARLISRGYAEREFLRFAFDWDTVRFWSSLSVTQRQSLGAGRALPLSSLSPTQLAILDTMVYHSPMGPSGRPMGNPRGRGQQAMSVQVMAGGGPLAAFFGGLANERTILMPTGIPRTGTLRLTTFSPPTVFAETANGQGGFVGAGEVAMSRASGSIPQFMGFGGGAPRYEKFRRGTSTAYNLNFVFGEGLAMSRSLTDARIDPTSPTMSFDQLPAGFRQQVEQAERGIRQGAERMNQMGNRGGRRGGGGGGRGAAPPPQP